MLTDGAKALVAIGRQHFDVIIYDAHSSGIEWHEFRDELYGERNMNKTALLVNAFDPMAKLPNNIEGNVVAPPEFYLPNPFTKEVLGKTLIEAIKSVLD